MTTPNYLAAACQLRYAARLCDSIATGHSIPNPLHGKYEGEPAEYWPSRENALRALKYTAKLLEPPANPRTLATLTPGRYNRRWGGYTTPVEVKSIDGRLVEIGLQRLDDPETMPDAVWEPVQEEAR
jgi:hypothetical protein